MNNYSYALAGSACKPTLRSSTRAAQALLVGRWLAGYLSRDIDPAKQFSGGFLAERSSSPPVCFQASCGE
jgi:hypothetical protein